MSTERSERRRTRRARVRRRVRGSGQRPRLSIYRSLHHIYAQVISDESGQTLVAASSLSPGLRDQLKSKSSVAAARVIGQAIAERCREKGLSEVVFDRNGFLYHGRLRALADAARQAGLKF